MNESTLSTLIADELASGRLTALEKKTLLELLKKRETYKRFNKAESFLPYPWQRQFYKAGANFTHRFLSAGNRCGKTFSQAYEFSLHLTGLYPDWWEGKRYSYPVQAWALGITVDSTRDVLQKELLGTPNAKDVESLGSGSIPRKYINFETIERDGGRILRVQVKHFDSSGKLDGYSNLAFKTSMMDETALMGAKLDLVWMDEQPPFQEEELHAQLTMRVADSNGSLTITATPEQGATNLLNDYRQNNGKAKYYQQVGWADCLRSDEIPNGHITQHWIDTQSKLIPAYQLQLRMNGEPILGSGAVYDVNLASVVCEPFLIPDSWRCVVGVDIGMNHDTAAIWSAYDAQNDVIYITGEHVLADTVPAIHAHALNSRGSWIPVILPKDAHQRDKGSGLDMIYHYKKAGANVADETFYNAIVNDGTKSQRVEPGITHIRERMLTGRFKIFSNCQQLLRQLETYYRDQGDIVKKNDDIADAMRYSAMSVIVRGRSKEETENYSAPVNTWSY